MEDTGESPNYIIGWLSSMINSGASVYPIQGYTIQHDIGSSVKFYQDKALAARRLEVLSKTCNEAKPENLYA
jgi:hypothetical protein